MNKEIYENYANYYISKFDNLKDLTITKKWANEEIMHIDIRTSLHDFEFFMGLYPYMVSFDGICVCYHGIEFEDIETVDPNLVYKFLDEESDLIKLYIKEGIFIFAYKDGKKVVSMSTDVLDRKKCFKNFDIKKFYNKKKHGDMPPFEDLDKIEIKDFYNNILFEYISNASEKK